MLHSAKQILISELVLSQTPAMKTGSPHKYGTWLISCFRYTETAHQDSFFGQTGEGSVWQNAAAV